MSDKPLYAILDCAVDPALYEHACRLGPLAARCLFQGRLHPTVKAVSPHLVELEPDDPLALAWAREGRGANWGVMIESDAGLHRVWRRVRHFTQATLPDGEGPYLFRFWDPRVMRAFLPLLEAEQLPEWFTDIDAWRVEAEGGSQILRYARTGGEVSIRPV